jgi:hypothetical protein
MSHENRAELCLPISNAFSGGVRVDHGWGCLCGALCQVEEGSQVRLLRGVWEVGSAVLCSSDCRLHREMVWKLSQELIDHMSLEFQIYFVQI